MSAAPWKPQEQPKFWALTTGWHISVWKTRATLALLRIALKSGTVLQLAEVKWADLRKRWKDINILGLFSCEGLCLIKKIELDFKGCAGTHFPSRIKDTFTQQSIKVDFLILQRNWQDESLPCVGISLTFIIGIIALCKETKILTATDNKTFWPQFFWHHFHHQDCASALYLDDRTDDVLVVCGWRHGQSLTGADDHVQGDHIDNHGPEG